MENRIGNKAPTAEEVQQLRADLDSIHKRLSGWCIDLGVDERSGGPRFRAQGPEMARLLAQIAARHGVAVKGADLAGMEVDIQVMEAAVGLARVAAQISQRLEDTANEAEREAVDVFLKVYSRLSNVAETDTALASEIQPLVDHMASPRRKKG